MKIPENNFSKRDTFFDKKKQVILVKVVSW